MSASLLDLLMQVASEGSVTTMANPGKSIGATGFNITSATGWPTTTGFIVAIRQVDGNGDEVAGTYTEWVATLSGTAISLGAAPSPLIGSDQNYTAGSTTQCYIPLSSTRDNNLVNALMMVFNKETMAFLPSPAFISPTITSGLTTDTLDVTSTSDLQGAVTLGSRLIPSKISTTTGTTITPTAGTTNIYEVTALATSATIAAPSGSPSDGQLLTLRIKDNGSNQSLTWNSTYRAVACSLPSATVGGRVLYVGMRYNSQDTYWDVLAVSQY